MDPAKLQRIQTLLLGASKLIFEVGEADCKGNCEECPLIPIFDKAFNLANVVKLFDEMGFAPCELWYPDEDDGEVEG